MFTNKNITSGWGQVLSYLSLEAGNIPGAQLAEWASTGGSPLTLNEPIFKKKQQKPNFPH